MSDPTNKPIREMAFAEPGESHLIDVVDPITLRSRIEGETLEEIRVRYPRAELVVLDEWLAAKTAVQDAPGEWLPETEERYWEMLEVLPPAAQSNGGFLVGEPSDHHAGSGLARYQMHRERQGTWEVYSRPVTRPEFRALLSA